MPSPARCGERSDTTRARKDTCSPPVRLIAAPVVNDDSSDASRVASAAVSVAAPRRPAGIFVAA